MNLQLRIEVDKSKRHTDKLFVCYNVWKVANNCPKIDDKIMKIEREDERCGIRLFGKYRFPFSLLDIPDNDLHASGCDIRDDGQFQKLLAENFKDDTETAVRESSEYTGKMFRKDFEYA